MRHLFSAEGLAALAATMRARPLLAFDFDGTLAPIVARPERAAVPAATRRVLEALVRRPRTHVAVVSGRAAADAARVAGVPRVWVIGNHGAERIDPGGRVAVDPLVASFADAVAAAARELAPAVARTDGAELEDKRWTLTVHYRRVADEALVGALRAAAAGASRAHGLALREGKKVFELRPPVRVDKGVASLRLASELGALAPAASLLYAGDDATDEDAFRALRDADPRALTVRVASRVGVDAPTPTAAEFTVPDLPALRALLEQVVQMGSGSGDE
jgi:trehalose-phosphatase